MTTREQADALARELVALGAFRWVAGMATVHHERVLAVSGAGLVVDDINVACDGDSAHAEHDTLPHGPWAPSLLDPATAACLAVQAMEAGATLAHMGDGWWIATLPNGQDPRGPLGMVAARALIASKGGG